MMAMLRGRVPYHDDEGHLSFAARLAARNRFPSIRKFWTAMGLLFQPLVDGEPEAVAKLAELGGVDPARLAPNLLVRHSDTEFSFNGERIVKLALRRFEPAVCLGCLAEDIASSELAAELAVYGRAEWTIGFVRTCEKHGPLTTLPAAAHATNTHEFVQSVAPLLAALPDWRQPDAVRAMSECEVYLTGRLRHGITGTDWLDQLDFYTAARACEMFGAVASFGPMVSLKRLTEDDWALAAATGFDIAKGGEPEINRFLTGLHAGASVFEGPQAIYGRVFHWLTYSRETTSLDTVRDLVRRHIVETMPVGPGDELFGKPVETRRLHSVQTASRQYGIHPVTLRKTLIAAGLIQPLEGNLMESGLFSAVQAEPMLVAMADGLEAREILGFLGISRMHAKVLIDNKVIKPIVDADGIEVLYARAHLNDLLDRLAATAVAVIEPMPHQVSIATAVKKACCGIMDVVQPLLDAELAWVGQQVGVTGYGSILVDLEEIKLRVRLPDPDGVLLSAMAREIGVPHAAVKALVDMQELKTEEAVNPINRCPQLMVTSTSFAAFTKQYVSLRDLARQTGKWPRHIMPELEAKGVMPVEQFRPSGGILYRRSDLA